MSTGSSDSAAVLRPNEVRDRLRRRRVAWAQGRSHLEARPHRELPAPAATERTIDSPAAWSVAVHVVERERVLRGWSRQQLARAAHVDPKTLRDLLAGRRQPNLGTVQTICAVLGISLVNAIRFHDRP